MSVISYPKFIAFFFIAFCLVSCGGGGSGGNNGSSNISSSNSNNSSSNNSSSNSNNNSSNSSSNSNNSSSNSSSSIIDINVVVSSSLPFPVILQAGDQTLSIQTENVTFSRLSPLDGVKILSNDNPQICELTEGALDSKANTKQYTLACREYIALNRTEGQTPGIYLVFDDGSERLLEAGVFAQEAIEILNYSHLNLLVSKAFGLRSLILDKNDIHWEAAINDSLLPNGAQLLEFYLSKKAAYLNYQDDKAEWTVLRCGVSIDPETMNVIEGKADTSIVDSTIYTDQTAVMGIIPVSYEEDIVATEEFRASSNEKNLRNIVVYQDGSYSGSFSQYAIDVGISQVVAHQSEGFFFFGNDDFKTSGSLQASMTMQWSLLESNKQPLKRNLDTDLYAATWHDPEGKKHIFTLGDKLFTDNLQSDQLAEWVLDSEGNFSWKPIDVLSEKRYGYMTTDGKLMILTHPSSELEHGLSSVLTREKGRVDLSQLLADNGVGTPPRVQFEHYGIGRGGSQFNRARIINGWTLLFSGSDGSGSIWMTNGDTQHTWQIATNKTWQNFLDYRLFFAGKNMAVVKTDSGELQLINKR